MAAIEAQGLRKVFRTAKKGAGLRGAVRHLFSPRTVEKVAVAYVGPNGAGKSTTVKMLAGILIPTAGELRVNGRVPHRDRMAHARQIAVVFGQRTTLWWDLPVRESLKLLQAIYAIPDAVYRRNLDLFHDLLGLGELLPVAVRHLSLGQRMRADLAGALLHNPPLLFLDEPTIGLDVAVKDQIRRFIRQVNAERGTTVLLTSHDLGDIEDLCRRMVILDRGRIVYDGGLLAVKERFARERELRLRLNSAPTLTASEEAALAEAGLTLDRESSHVVLVRFDRTRTNAAEVVGRLLPLYDVADFELREPGIEQVLKRVYSGQLDLAGADAATRRRAEGGRP
jgi:ABC-2 type transport system ATP-binding protein